MTDADTRFTARRGAQFAASLLMLFCISSFSSKQIPPTTLLNLRNFGAAGDGMSDDGPAFQSALNALATSGGGTLYVPPGRYAIATPVSKDFSAAASSITIAGEKSRTAIDIAGNGSGLNLTSELIVKVGPEHVALTLRGLDHLLIRDVAFVGVQEVRDDAHVVLLVGDIPRVNVVHCEFYGLASLAPGGSIVAAHGSGLKVDQTAFLGCATNSAHSTSIIQNLTWKDITITNTKFIDYGTRSGFFSKTPLAPPYSWIGIGNAAAAHPDSFRREAIIRNVFLDEGAFIGISARPDLYSPPTAPFDVFISGIRMNVTNLAACGIYLSGVDKVLIERSHLGWSHNADAAIVLRDVQEAILDRVECVAHANTIRADAHTQRLVIIDSLYKTLESAAPYTKEITTRNPMNDPVQYVRREYLAVLGTEPDLQALHFWADVILRCEDDASCFVEKRAALADYLGTAPPAAFAVAGRIIDQDGTAIADVTVRLAGSHSVTAQTDAEGQYSFANLSTAGQYTLTPSKNHYAFSSQTLNTPTSDQRADFAGALKASHDS